MKRSDKLKAGKFDVDAALVRQLLQDQFPEFSVLPVEPLEDDGWDNWTFRLGAHHKVRLPSDAAYAAQAEKEFAWLPKLAPHLPLAIPKPVALGMPNAHFPWSWSIYEWIAGAPLGRQADLDRNRLAGDLADFLKALWVTDRTGGPPPGAHNFYRGGDVIDVYGPEARAALSKLAGSIDLAGAVDLLNRAAASTFEGEPVWVHGDIAVGNLLVRDSRLAAVIDFGSSAVGDPACDLAITWLYFDGESRAKFRDAVAVDKACWARARAWALWKAAIVMAANSPVYPDETPPIEVIETVVGEHRQQFS